MAGKKKTTRAAKAGKTFHVDLNADNWSDFTGNLELQDFLDSFVSGVVEKKAQQGGKKSVNLKISMEPKGGPSANSNTAVASVSICKRPPC